MWIDEEGEGGAADDGSVNVIDIVDAFRLQEIELDKKAWTAYIKGTHIWFLIEWFLEYLKKIKAKLEEQGKKDRVPTFQKGATAFVKHIIEKYDEIQIFAGENYDMEAGFGYCYYKDQSDAGPTFFFFADGMTEEKYWISIIKTAKTIS